MSLELLYPKMASKIAAARDGGYDDSEIELHIADKAKKATTAGYSPEEIRAHLGSPTLNPDTLQTPEAAAEGNPNDVMGITPNNTEGLSDIDRAAVRSGAGAAIASVARPIAKVPVLTEKALLEGGAAMSNNIGTMTTELAKVYGVDGRDLEGMNAFFQRANDQLMKNADYFKQRSDELGADNTVTDIVAGAAGGGIPGITEFVAGVPYSMALGAAEASKHGENPFTGALHEGVKRLLIGQIFRGTHGMTKTAAVPTNATMFAGQTAAEGGSPEEIIKAAGTGAIYAGMHSGTRTLKEAKADFQGTLKSDIQHRLDSKQGRYVEFGDSTLGQNKQLRVDDKRINPTIENINNATMPPSGMQRKVSLLKVDPQQQPAAILTQADYANMKIAGQIPTDRMVARYDEAVLIYDHVIVSKILGTEGVETTRKAVIDKLAKGDVQDLMEPYVAKADVIPIDKKESTSAKPAEPTKINTEAEPTPDHVITQISKLGKSIEGQQRKAILTEIGKQLNEGKTIDAIHQEIAEMAAKKGLPKEFHDYLRGIIGTLKDDANPGSDRVGVGGGKGNITMSADRSKGDEVSRKSTDTEFVNAENNGVAMPELLELYSELTQGKLPMVQEALSAPGVQGEFWNVDSLAHGGVEAGQILLKKSLFKSAEAAERTFRHEIGHLWDWLPGDHQMKHGESILGKINGVRNFMEESLTTNRLGEVRKSDIDQELRDLSKWWKPFDDFDMTKEGVTYTDYRYSSHEMYADAVSVLLTNPVALRERAPKFYDALMENMDAKPEVLRAYKQIQSQISDPWNLFDTREQNIRNDYAEWEAKIADRDQKNKSLNAGGRAMQEYVDQHSEIQRMVREYEKSTGERLPAEQNPVYALEEVAHTFSQVKEYMTQIDGKNLKKLEEAGVTYEDLSDVMLHQHIIHNRKGIHSTRGHNERTSTEFLESMRHKLGDDVFETVDKVAREFRKIREDLIIPEFEKSEMFNDPLMEAIKSREFYAKMDVVDYIESKIGKFSGSGDLLKMQEGSFRGVGNAYAATIMQDVRLLREIAINRAARKTVNFLHRIPGSITKANHLGDAPKGKGTIKVVHKGEVKAFHVDEFVANSFKNEPTKTGLAVELLGKTNSYWRNIFVQRNPGFWLFNGVRDYKRAAKNLQGSGLIRFMPYYMRALKPAAKEMFGIADETISQMRMNRMLISVENYRGLGTEDKAMERMLVKAGLSKKGDNFIRKGWDALGEIGQFVEVLPKIAGKEYLEKNFPDMKPEEVAHRVRTQVGSPDFLRKGASYKSYNNILLFSNAIKEGWRGDIEVMKERPAEYMLKTGLYDLLPKALMAATAMGALDHVVQNGKEIMAGISEYDKTNYFIIPLYLDENGASVYLRMPHDETGRFFGGLLWKSMKVAGATGGVDQSIGAKDVAQIADYMAGQAPTVSPTISLAGDVAAYAMGLNRYDAFSQREVIPPNIEKEGAFSERSNKKWAEYFHGEVGGSIIHKIPFDRIDRPKTGLEEKYDIPFVGPILQRFLKTSDVGLRQRYREVGDKAGQEVARHSNDINDWIINDVNELNAGMGENKVGRKQAVTLYKALKKEGKLNPVFDDPHQFIAKYLRVATKSKDSVKYDVLMSSPTAKEKVFILNEFEKDMTPEAFRKFTIQAIKQGVISKDTLKMKSKMGVIK